MGGQCLWSLCSGRPTGVYCGTGRETARRKYAEKQQQKKDQKLWNNEAPRELPAVRKRALTIPLPSENLSFWKREQQTLDQLQSPLFGRLPLEVRELIFKYYLTPDGQPMHIFRRTDKRLGHCFCTFEPGSHSHYPSFNWGYGHPSRTQAWQKISSGRPEFSNNILPLLKSCRRAYSEAVPILYASNIFCFQDIAALRYFVRTVLPHRLSQVTAIQLPWMKSYLGFPHPNGQLTQVWQALEQLPSLRKIYIVRLATRAASCDDWIFPAWTYWIPQLKLKKPDVQFIGYEGFGPTEFALRMPLNEGE
ncbi:MAG: hypothetical protein Q9213_002088 [Squamulea squamosa]